MRKGSVATLLAFAMLGSATPAAAGGPIVADGYGAAFSGESAFTAAPAGTTARLTAIFANTGTRPWLPGVVGLLVCAEDQVTCGVASPNAAYDHDWYASSVYATAASVVEPGQDAFFSYDIVVPKTTAAGVTAIFYGAVGLIESGAVFELDGYYQANTTPLVGHRLNAAFLSDPIPSGGTGISRLQVDVVGPGGERDVDDDSTVVSLSQADATLTVCLVQNARATVTEGRAEFDVLSGPDPGSCDISVTDDRGASTTATLTTKRAGSPVRLTVSGNDSPKAVGGGAPIEIAVDIDDVNVELVPDATNPVTMALDPATCSGATGGNAYVTTSAAVSAVDGRAWFTVRSNGAYRDCRVTVTSPGLPPSVTVISFLAGPPHDLTCTFSPAVIEPESTATAAVELRDVFGNAVQSLDLHVATFIHTSGGATALVGDTTEPLVLGAAFFTVRSGANPGIDVYTAILGESAETACAITVRPLAP